MVPAAWRHAGTLSTRRTRPLKVCSESLTFGKALSEIPCRVRRTCLTAPQGAEADRLISGKPYLAALPPAGNPEGSPCDPVTTDPKGEARRAAATSQHAGPHRSSGKPMEERVRTRDVHLTPKGADEVKG
jgi:hypothetical protein